MSDSSQNNTPSFSENPKISDRSDANRNASIAIRSNLNLTGQSAGHYYFNRQNNYEYTKNWFNYGQFHVINQAFVVDRVVQSAHPKLENETLDTTKQYDIPSTSVSASWGARVETGINTNIVGCSGKDANDNVYVLSNYQFPYMAMAYNANNTLAFVKNNNGFSVAAFGPQILFVSRTATGTAVLILSADASSFGLKMGDYISVAGITNDANSFNTVIPVPIMISGNMVTYSNPTGTQPFGPQPVIGTGSISVGAMCTCITKYNSSGMAQWSSRIVSKTPGKSTLAYYCITDHDGTTYVMGEGEGQHNVLFENAVGTVIYDIDLTYKSYLVAYDTMGTPKWITFFTIGYRGYLWVDNIPINGNVYMVYPSINGSTFYDEVPVSPTPVLTLPPSNIVIAKFNASTGFFIWATYISGYRVTNWRDYIDYNSQSITTDLSGNVYITGYYTDIESIVNAAPAYGNIGSVYPTTMSTNTTPVGYIASSSDLNIDSWKAFDNDISTVWKTTSANYNPVTGAYTGAIATLVDGVNILGEWIQIQLPSAIKLGQIILTPDQNLGDWTRFSPQNFTIAGSIDGIEWRLVSTFTDQIYPVPEPKAFTITNLSSSFFYYRLITTVAGGGATLGRTDVSITQWTLVDLTSNQISVPYPPFSSPLVFEYQNTFREWLGVDANYTGSVVVAVDYDGFIYVSRDVGNKWRSVATRQKWTSIFCNGNILSPNSPTDGNLMIATVYDSVIYRSEDFGETWNVTGGEGANGHKWNAIGGNLDGSLLVATTQSEYLYCSKDYGKTWYLPRTIQYLSSNTCTPVNGFVSSVIQLDGYYAYFGTSASPAQIVKVDVENNTQISTITLNAGENNLTCGVVSGDFAYFGTSTTPGQIVKIHLPTFTRVGAITLNPGEDNLTCAVVDPIGQYAYFGTSTSPGKIVKIDLITFTRVSAITLNAGEDNLSCGLVITAGNYLLFGTYTTPAKIVIIDVLTFTRYGNITLTNTYNLFQTAAADPLGPYVYFGTYTSPGKIVRINTISFTEVGQITLNPGEDNLSCSVAHPKGQYLYFGTYTSPGAIITIEMSNFTRLTTQTISLVAGQDQLKTMLINNTGLKIIIGTDTVSPQSILIESTVSSPSNKNWGCIAYDGYTSTFFAFVNNDFSYKSTDGGTTWTQLMGSPINEQWIVALGWRSPTFNPIYAVLVGAQDGSFYAIDNSGLIWTPLDTAGTPSAGYLLDTIGQVFDIFQSGGLFFSLGVVWTQINEPKEWVRVSQSGNGKIGLVSLRYGRIYVSTEFSPQRHTFLIKYNPDGVVEWTNYVNCPLFREGDNMGVSLVSTPKGEILLSGICQNTVEFYNPDNFTTPVKSITINNTELFFNEYLACYSSDGIPLWVTSSILGYLPDPSIPSLFISQYKSISVDHLGNIYCFGYATDVVLSNPDGRQVFASPSPTKQTAILTKYYSNGYVQSFTRIQEQSAIGRTFGCSIYAVDAGDIYISGTVLTPPGLIQYNNAPGNTPGLAFPIITGAAVFVGKYTSSPVPCTFFPPVSYNVTLQPQIAIGGSSRILSGTIVKDNDLEIWSGKGICDFNNVQPSAVELDDINTGITFYLGHTPGFSFLNNDFVDPILYRYLCMSLSEPSFPKNDGETFSIGSIPYGYLPFFIPFPSYTTGTEYFFDTNGNIVLSATGPLPASGISIPGIYSGDTIRILIHTPTTSQYVTFTVKGLITSNVALGIQPAIVFNEKSLYLISLLKNSSMYESPVLYIGPQRLVPAFYQQPLMKNGKINVSLQLIPREPTQPRVLTGGTQNTI